MSDPKTAVPLWAPDYSAGFSASNGRFWRKYAQFSGRASRGEYWWAYLVLAAGYLVSLTLLYTGLGIWSGSNDEGPPPVIFPVGLILTVAWFLATLVPWLALEARRLHDANKSALLLLLHLASWPGAIAVFVLDQLAPSPLGRRFDAPPGEAPRFARIGDWPAAPGEPATQFPAGYFNAAPLAATPAPAPSQQQPPSEL